MKTEVETEAEKLLKGAAEMRKDADRWREYCRMMVAHDNEAMEEFGAIIPPGAMTKDALDLAMDAWLARRAENG